MTDAPETIWITSMDADWFSTDPSEHRNGAVTEYRRTDLPPTPEQIMADTRVQALVEALKNARHELEEYEAELRGETYNSPEINAALATLEKP